MKTKLSLVLPLCLSLGLVLTFVLAACSGSTSVPPDSTSSSGGAVYHPSSDVQAPGIVEIRSFEVTTYGEKVYLTSSIEGSKEEPIVKVEILTTQPGWISYNDLGGNPKTFSPGVKTITLNAEVDLNEASIKCSDNPHSITVKACIDQACSPGKYATETGTFEKPGYLCVLSSSGGALSSSSEAAWVFGAPQFNDVSLNSPVSIGSGSFKLTGDDDGQPDMEVTNGKIRLATSLGVDDESVVPGKSYSSKENALGSSVPASSKLEGEYGVQNKEYYLIYLNDGNKYLVQFEGKPKWIDWPKKCTYWLATESP